MGISKFVEPIKQELKHEVDSSSTCCSGFSGNCFMGCPFRWTA